MMEIKVGQKVSVLFGSNYREGKVVKVVGTYHIVQLMVSNELEVVYGLYELGTDKQPIRLGANVEQVVAEYQDLVVTK